MCVWVGECISALSLYECVWRTVEAYDTLLSLGVNIKLLLRVYGRFPKLFSIAGILITD